MTDIMTGTPWPFGEWWVQLNRALAGLGDFEAMYGEAKRHYDAVAAGRSLAASAAVAAQAIRDARHDEGS